MNVHGIMSPVVTSRPRPRPSLGRVGGWIWQRRIFFGVVVAPLLLIAGYYFLVASDQYEAEAHYLVRSANSSDVVPGAGMSQALSMVTGVSAAQNEAMSVADYLTSHDAVEALRAHAGLVARFHDRGADFFSRLRQSDPTPETLLRYYQRQVSVRYNTETGITVLKVHSFRPEDSYLLVRRLLELGEARVNVLNQRSYADAITMAQRQLADAEIALGQNQARMTNFRQNRRDIDPQAQGEAQIGLVSTLTGQLAAARAQLQTMSSMIDRSSPQYRAVAARAAALQAQVTAQAGRLTGDHQAIAADIGGYQDLQLRQQFLAKRYEAAAAGLEHARDNAVRQQLYLVRVVDANMPVKSLFPRRWLVLSTIALGLLLAYSIGWLIVAGVKEHAA